MYLLHSDIYYSRRRGLLTKKILIFYNWSTVTFPWERTRCYSLFHLYRRQILIVSLHVSFHVKSSVKTLVTHIAHKLFRFAMRFIVSFPTGFAICRQAFLTNLTKECNIRILVLKTVQDKRTCWFGFGINLNSRKTSVNLHVSFCMSAEADGDQC